MVAHFAGTIATVSFKIRAADSCVLTSVSGKAKSGLGKDNPVR
jgi:hypothetical protein